MHFGTQTLPHISRPEDRYLLRCFCGWRSEEMSVNEFHERGLPLWCGAPGCRRQDLYFMRFHPSERARAEAEWR